MVRYIIMVWIYMIMHERHDIKPPNIILYNTGCKWCNRYITILVGHFVTIRDIILYPSTTATSPHFVVLFIASRQIQRSLVLGINRNQPSIPCGPPFTLCLLVEITLSYGELCWSIMTSCFTMVSCNYHKTQ